MGNILSYKPNVLFIESCEVGANEQMHTILCSKLLVSLRSSLYMSEYSLVLYSETEMVSTTENVALVIYVKIASLLPEGISLHSIKIHETDKNIVEYRGEEEEWCIGSRIHFKQF